MTTQHPTTHLRPCSSWFALRAESDRDGYNLKPLLWEGPGEYQRYAIWDETGVLVKVDSSGRVSEAARAALAKVAA
jgi:hypothetical protein